MTLTPAERAADLLQHYLHRAYTAAGLPWGPDDDDGVEAIVTALCQAADDAVQAHAEEAPHLYPDGNTT